MRKISTSSFRYLFITPLVLLALAVSTYAQQPFNKNEFVARRAKLFEKISDGVAVLFAAKGQHYPVKFRQSPDFYYLTGVEEPGAVLVMSGPSKRTFLYVPRRSEPQIRADGPGIWQMDKREEVYGVTRVQPIEEFLPMFAFLGSNARKLYMLTGSGGNVQNAREELDYYESLEMSQSVFGGVTEAKKAIAVIAKPYPPSAIFQNKAADAHCPLRDPFFSCLTSPAFAQIQYSVRLHPPSPWEGQASPKRSSTLRWRLLWRNHIRSDRDEHRRSN